MPIFLYNDEWSKTLPTVKTSFVLWTRICFNADPDPAFFFYLDAFPDPDPSQTSLSLTIKFLHDKYTLCTGMVDNRS